jgi:hypothetical protein
MILKNKKLLFFCLIIIASCGKVRSQRLYPKKDQDYKGIGAFEEPAQKNYSKDELVIVNRLCSVLKTKREALELVTDKLIYHFSDEKRNCKNVVTDTYKTTALIRMISGDLELSAQSGDHVFTNIITDKTDYLSALCEQALSTSTPIETKKISNFNLLNDKLYKISVVVNSEGYDSLHVTTRILDSKGSFVPAFFEEIVIATNASQLGVNNVGVEKSRLELTPCGGTEFKTKKALWLSSSVPFN